jgi:hypothetical protein
MHAPHRALLLFAALAACDGPAKDTDSPTESDTEADTEPAETDSGSSDSDVQLLACDLAYDLPSEIDPGDDGLDQADVEAFAWRSFLALSSDSVGGSPSNTSPQWQGWSSTVDLLSQGPTPGPSGSRHYPAVCMANYPDSYASYRVLDQLDKIDDDLLEASRAGLSNSPVITGSGAFLRYEILISPLTYAYVVAAQYNLPATMTAATANLLMPCGDPTYTGGDPAEGADLPVEQMLDAGVGPIVLKLAWMDTAGLTDTSSLFTEELLVYTPADRTTDGVETCELATMGLVGMHLVRKTLGQQAWTWTTIEHQNTAPDCYGSIPDNNMGIPGDPGPNTGCPVGVSTSYWFFDATCGDNNPACAACNTTPDSNAGPGECLNPDQPGNVGWCPNEAPAEQAGLSKLCRQVPVTADGPYAAAYHQNAGCQAALAGAGSVWANYEVISTQWFTGTLPAATSCGNVSATVVDDKDAIAPLVTLAGQTEPSKPFLGNSSMESYERSNCMGCHSKATTAAPSGPSGECGKAGNYCSDFSYWLGIEVPNAAD